MTLLRTLYIDMNSFFASVEQHENPALRGKPVAITAIDSTSGACVAASYEAKAHGIKTGTSVREARQLCPGITFLPSRHRLYVRYNLRIAAILDEMAELERIRSVDEFQLVLSGPHRTIDGAFDLVRRMKRRVATEIGPAIRFSAGMGPNHLLAKIAGKLEKPDGCQWLAPENMPDRLAHLALDDLPGISRGILQKLHRAGIMDIPALYRLDPRHARAIWRSVEGERFVRALQGMDIPLTSTSRHGYGNSKVLAPDKRRVRPAYLVGRWLLAKATARMRRDGRVATELMLSVRRADGGWSDSIRCRPSSDTAYFLSLHRDLWERHIGKRGPGAILSVSIHLGHVADLTRRTGDLLLPLGPAEKTAGERASDVIDLINRRYGADTIRHGVHLPHPGFFERG
ncbi:DNA polymerase-4 [Thalassovita litoralis]|uniref:DNA-directed DNA polymerase n=1 Tax=Thalassovita litoralis TaxID=1010611 RepID=A0A521CJX8_9RHOB|nr:UMUC-like DNA-repair protein [Thalassovita litoralis]SMO59747.1 DNA polymerase-4 [Thalassovita litoralis]